MSEVVIKGSTKFSSVHK